MSQPTAADDAAPVTMRAVVVTRPGGLDALEIKDVPVLVRKPGWVRIKVKAFGVNESEVTTRKGESDAEVTYPRVPGIEGVGVVDEADEGSGLRPGRQVATMMGGMGRAYDGAYAQYVSVPAAQVIPFESSLPGVFAAGDVRHGSVKRVAGAVGEGSVAVGSVHQYLAQLAASPATGARHVQACDLHDFRRMGR